MRIIRAVAVSTALLTAGLIVPGSPAHAQSISLGCDVLHSNDFSTTPRPEITLGPLPFLAGETITGLATAPAGDPPPAEVMLLVAGVTVDTALFDPAGAEVSYTVPTSGDLAIQFTSTDNIPVTWHLDCVADPVVLLEGLQDLVATLDPSAPGGLEAKVSSALAKLGIGDTTGACGSLSAFINQVAAQTNKTITPEQSTELTNLAMEIETVLGCP